MHRVGDVLQHQEDVSHGDGAKDQVDRVGAHVLVTNNNDVEKVEECSKDADHKREVTMKWKINSLK